MGISANTARLKLAQVSKKPVLLYGEEGRLHGTLYLQNISASKLTLSSIPIETVKIRDQANEPLSNLRVRGRLLPNEQGMVYIDYPIDPTTPPGIYKAKLLIGGEQQAAEISIAEHVELEIEPDTITLNTESNPNYAPEFKVTNTGNVDISLGKKLIVPLKSEQSLETSLQSGLAELTADRSETDIQLVDLISAIARQLAGSLTVTWGQTTIKPGETKTIKWKIDLPDNIQPHRYYYADILLYSADVHLDIYT